VNRMIVASVFVCALCVFVVYFYHGGTEGTKVHRENHTSLRASP
jgi:hypothetical protein